MICLPACLVPTELSRPHVAPFLRLLLPQASIDQVDGLITFKTAQEPLAQWDRNIQGLCQMVNTILDEVEAKGYKVDVP